MRSFSVIALLALGAGVASAQTPAPYAGMQGRQIKSLSDQQIADLKAGRGMGLALPAELNGYPGPAHVLELGQMLKLSDEQKAAVGRLFEDMRGEAVAIGERLIVAETNLDRLFVDKTVTEVNLTDATRAAASLQGDLRAAHLKYHLATLALLTPEQVARYGELRGYASGAVPGGHGGHKH